MADFFEQLGKKISDVAEDFGKKTEDTLDGDYPWSRREAGKDIPGQMDLPVEGTAYRAAGM